MEGMFCGCYKLRVIKGINKFNTINVKNMNGMFRNCYDLEYLDLSNFNTSNVVNMEIMFLDCNKFYKNKVKYINGKPQPFKLVGDMEYEERIELGKKLKEEGEQIFKNGDYEKARKKWDDASIYLDKYYNKFDEEEKKGCELYQITLSNLCNVCEKLKDYNSVIKYANIGIKINKELPKYFYFRAIAFSQTSKIENAEKDLESLEKLLSGNEKEKAEVVFIRNIINRKKEEIKRQQIIKFSKLLFGRNFIRKKGWRYPQIL